MELLAEALIVIQSIGAFVRWALTGFNGTFMNRFEKGYPFLDCMLGLAFVIVTIIGAAKLVGYLN